MDKYIVTISRQFGSLGRTVAAELSRRLNVEYLDRDIVDETAKRMGLPVTKISNVEEKQSGNFLSRAYPLGNGMAELKDAIFEVQKNIIEDFAKEQSGIVVGRCGDYILRNHPRLLSVYIYASRESRLKNCIERLGMDERTAKRMIADVDNAREHYHRTYIPGYKDPFFGRDICIDSGSFGAERTADILEGIIRKQFYD